MARPTYETEVHLGREKQVIEVIERIHGVTFQKCPNYYHIDYFLIDQHKNVNAWVEIRGKEFEKAKFPTFFTSLEKYISICRMAHLTGKPAILVANWTDTANYYKADHTDLKKFDIKLGGRTSVSRGDWQDIEPVVHIPTNLFKPLSEMPLK